MAEKSLKPEIRFAGFTEDWEQRKLSDFLVTSTDKNLDNLYTKQDVLSVSGEFGVVNQIEFQGRSFAGVSVSNYGVVSTGDVVYTKSPLSSNPYGIVKTNKGRPGIVSTLYAIYHPMPSTDSNFIQVYFEQNARVNNYLHPLVNKGAKNDMKVTADNALKGLVIFPKCKEQKRISELFAFLDNLITLHQRKCDKLIDFKKAMLEKMFPKDGTDMPEIRFAGFTGAWERCKLGEITSLITKGTTPLDKKSNGNINFIKIENIDSSSGEITKTSKITQEEHDGYLKRSQLQENDILFSIAGTLGRVTTVKKEILPANTNQAIAIIRLKKGNINYITTYLKGKVVSLFIKKNPTVGAQPNLSLEQVGSLEISLPDINEQTKIGKFFCNLDHLITLHQRELEKLKNIKKAMLDKMFV